MKLNKLDGSTHTRETRPTIKQLNQSTLDGLDRLTESVKNLSDTVTALIEEDKLLNEQITSMFKEREKPKGVKENGKHHSLHTSNIRISTMGATEA